MKTFKIGGVHPAENKLSAASPIREAALPKQAVFSMFQHIGAPAKPIVKKGDVVKVGTMIAEAGGFVSAPVHSSVSGTVSKVDVVIDASGTRRQAIFVDVNGDEWEDAIDRSPELVRLSDRPELDAATIINKVKEAGIVGLGGATFPCHVKLSPPPGSKAECVIINAVECEPYLTADHRLMLEHPEEILVGVSLIMKAVSVEKGYIGIENNKPDAIRLMTEKAQAYPNIEIVPLKVKYPQGGEKQLIDAVIGRQVPAPPAIPISVGAVVQNVGTAFAIYQAVMKNKPLVDRIIT
ncbi:MAG: RnfABCDGE type electron transport complex subunit C, partial [Bacteroidaceae bacterium]|nr:RnfABCDGE type electron transport complex subunit C [Bacteroidaceae bacterium]